MLFPRTVTITSRRRAHQIAPAPPAITLAVAHTQDMAGQADLELTRYASSSQPTIASPARQARPTATVSGSGRAVPPGPPSRAIRPTSATAIRIAFLVMAAAPIGLALVPKHLHSTRRPRAIATPAPAVRAPSRARATANPHLAVA